MANSSPGIRHTREFQRETHTLTHAKSQDLSLGQMIPCKANASVLCQINNERLKQNVAFQHLTCPPHRSPGPL